MDCKKEVELRSQWIKKIVTNASAKGVVFGNSGGKDCALAGILAKLSGVDVLSVLMPCEAVRNYTVDTFDAIVFANHYNIPYITVDITPIKKAFINSLGDIETSNPMVYANINPRLRMTALYAIAQANNYLVLGTGNLSEISMGYFTKWGDGASDLNPMSDLTVTQVYQLLRYLNCPDQIINKAPSAALYDGQTDEKEMGISYDLIDEYLLTGKGIAKERVDKAFKSTAHKRAMPLKYPELPDSVNS